METKLTRAQLIDMLGCSMSTLRKYEREFREFLDAEKGVKGSGKAKFYNEHDARVFATINALRERNVTYEEMHAGELRKALDRGMVEFIPEDAATREASDKGERALVPVEQYAQAVAMYEATNSMLERSQEELEDARRAIVDAERRAASGAAYGDAIREERDRLLARLEELEEKLEDARRPWYQKLMGGGKK